MTNNRFITTNITSYKLVLLFTSNQLGLLTTAPYRCRNFTNDYCTDEQFRNRRSKIKPTNHSYARHNAVLRRYHLNSCLFGLTSISMVDVNYKADSDSRWGLKMANNIQCAHIDYIATRRGCNDNSGLHKKHKKETRHCCAWTPQSVVAYYRFQKRYDFKTQANISINAPTAGHQ
jgi:hypothetical protein